MTKSAPWPASLPDPHREFLAGALTTLASDPRLVGVAAAGSFVSGTMDEFSDLDLVIAVEPDDHAAVMADRVRIAESLGPVLATFTGEHVGEPRLLVGLYAPSLLHVDLKFVPLPDAATRVDEIAVLWERDGRLSAVLATRPAAYPPPDPQWIEDRFWPWIHYVTVKIGRGELFETLDGLSFLRRIVLGPLGLARAGRQPNRVRRVEQVPSLADALRPTLAGYDRAECVAALRACVAVYRELRAPEGPELRYHRAAEEAVMRYLDKIEAR
jgi:hypothetical protein